MLRRRGFFWICLGVLLLSASVIIETFRPQSCAEDPSALSAGVKQLQIQKTFDVPQSQKIVHLNESYNKTLGMGFDHFGCSGDSGRMVFLLGWFCDIFRTSSSIRTSIKRI